ncbi:hypothetical protein JOC74_002603 [Bacillus capparidis]|uniref:Uncharacterized protein n=1 Tax=Bacillus capparidis TaxID=1840411 RepID=A0ABS4CXD6_9BACI|nr:hypothetical protein [Bacillus capparidis]
MMFWLRSIIIACFSLTALSLFLYQGTEIIHAISDFFHKKN